LLRHQDYSFVPIWGRQSLAEHLLLKVRYLMGLNYPNYSPIRITVLIDGKFSTYSYCDWIIRFVKFHGYQKHPKDMGKSEIEAFLSHLATHRRVSASTQRQALNALVFLYKHVLDKPIGDNIAPVKAKKRRRPPVVMAKTEVHQVLNQGELLGCNQGKRQLKAESLYGV